MPETARQAADEGFHEIQLTGKQLVFLFMATTVVAVVIFLCGVLVGRGVRAERTTDAAAATENAAPPAGIAGAGTAAGTASDRPAGNEDLSYAKRLQGDAPAEEQLKKPDATEPPPTPSDSAPDTPATTASPRPAPATTAAPAARAPSGWVVQIAALRDRGAADQIVKRLGAKGYPAFVVEPAGGAPALGFRVRVGPYSDRREAEKISRRLEREEQFKPFITR